MSIFVTIFCFVIHVSAIALLFYSADGLRSRVRGLLHCSGRKYLPSLSRLASLVWFSLSDGLAHSVRDRGSDEVIPTVRTARALCAFRECREKGRES